MYWFLSSIFLFGVLIIGPAILIYSLYKTRDWISAIETFSLYLIFVTLLVNMGAITWSCNQINPPNLTIQHHEVISEDGKTEIRIFYGYPPRHGLYFATKTISKSENISHNFSPFKNYQTTLAMTEERWEVPDNKIRIIAKDSVDGRVVENKNFSFLNPNIEVNLLAIDYIEKNSSKYGIESIFVTIKNTGELPFYFKPSMSHGQLLVENMGKSESFQFGNPSTDQGFTVFKETRYLEYKFEHVQFEGKLIEGREYAYRLKIGNAEDYVDSDRGIFGVKGYIIS